MNPQVNPDERATLHAAATRRLHVSPGVPAETPAAAGRPDVGDARQKGPVGDVLAALDRAIASTAPVDRPGLMVALATRLAQLGVALAVPATTGNVGPSPPQAGMDDRLLSPEQAAEVLGGVSAKWVLRHTKGLRFRRDLSRKVVRFEESGLRRWVGMRRA
jgi:hypothetical protein